MIQKLVSPQLLWWFKPRLILSGHTHSGCEVLHDNKYPEISVPSFSWRNRNNPSFIMVSGEKAFTLKGCSIVTPGHVLQVVTCVGDSSPGWLGNGKNVFWMQ